MFLDEQEVVIIVFMIEWLFVWRHDCYMPSLFVCLFVWLRCQALFFKKPDVAHVKMMIFSFLKLSVG